MTKFTIRLFSKGLVVLLFHLSPGLYGQNCGLVFSPEQPQLCGGSSVQLSVSGGISYQWSPATGLNSASVPNPVASPQTTTTYTVTANVGGSICVDSVTVVVLPQISISASDTVVCSGTEVTLYATGATELVWNGGVQSPIISVNPVVTTTYTVTGALGSCTSVQTFTVTALPTPSVSVNVSPGSNICPGANVILTANNFVNDPTVTYRWLPGGETHRILEIPSVTQSLTYTCVATNAAGCTDTVVVNVVVNGNASPFNFDVFSPDPTVCENDLVSIRVLGNGAFEGRVMPEQGILVPPVVPGGEYSFNGPPGNYTVTFVGTSPDGCTASRSLAVEIFPAPEIQVVSVPSALWCLSSQAPVQGTLTAVNLLDPDNSTTYRYQWLPGPNVLNPCENPPLCSRASVSHTPGATYTVTAWQFHVSGADDIDTCSATYTLSTPTQAGPLTVTASVVAGGCTRTGVTIAATTNRPATFVWRDGSGNVLPGSGNTNIFFPPPGISQATYHISAIEPGTGCFDETSVSVNFFPSPEVAVNPLVKLCVPGNALLSAGILNAAAIQAEGGSVEYNWQPGNAGGATFSVSPSESQTYTVRVRVVYPNSPVYPSGAICDETRTIRVEAVTLSVQAAAPRPACPGQTRILSAHALFSDRTPCDNCVFSWELDQQPVGVGREWEVVAQTPPGVRRYSVTARHPDGCSANTLVDWEVRSPPEVWINGQNVGAICVMPEENEGRLTASGAHVYSWSPNLGLSATAGPEVRAFFVDSILTYTVIGVDTVTDCEDTAKVTVRFSPTASPPYVDPSSVVTNGTQARGRVDFSRLTTGIPLQAAVTLYVNDRAVGLTPVLPDGSWETPDLPQALGECDAVYARVRFDRNCNDVLDDDDPLSEPGNIVVVPLGPFELRNAFTPNGDGRNDVFEVVDNLPDRFPDAVLQVFNRWGDMVYSAAPYRNDWTGDNLPEGTYFFLLQFNKCEAGPIKSHLTILR
jgi:gliding motility-associated-like protein